MSVKTIVGADTYERIRETLQKSFPVGGNVPDETVDAVILAIQRGPEEQAVAFGLPANALKNQEMARVLAKEDANAEEPIRSLSASTKAFPLYVAKATHARKLRMGSDKEFKSAFTEDLPLVRVRLPASFDGMGSAPKIETVIGTVDLSGDHLAGSIEQIVSKYNPSSGNAPRLGYDPERVDLITPARHSKLRFAAIAIYLGYRLASDATPSFYLFEAGTALGKAEELYFAAHMSDTITQASGYTPTQFSAPNNIYHGQMEMDGDEPKKMVVRSSSPGLPFYIEVVVKYDRVDTLDRASPGLLLANALMRSDTIAYAMGVSDDPPLAACGRGLPWINRPG